jgi:hypothetical protein
MKFLGLILTVIFLTALTGPGRSEPPALQESLPAVKNALNAVISRQLAAFQAGDFTRAYNLAAGEIRSKYDRATFEQMVRIGFPILTRSGSIKFGPALDDGENGVVYVRVGDAPERQLYLYSLKREKKDWKIIGVSQKEEDPSPATPASSPEMPPLSA